MAGYDVSRLMAGALGTLGVLLDLSVKVLPRPESERTLVLEMEAADALARMTTLAGKPLPISAACHHAGRLCLRLTGAHATVEQAQRQLGGEQLANGSDFWLRLREQQLDLFSRGPLWRLSVASDTPLLSQLSGIWLHDWGGAQRWLISDQPADSIRAAAAAVGGHATLFRTPDQEQRRQGVFQPLPAALLRYQQRLKQAFDPEHIFNPQRLYPEF
ncbi:MAG: hypothetical protein R3E95_23550 [Thiolinea sp.]